tara:strand:- start:9375 stop:10127 length:753 start_codon:yes stop_codon:yes gene_type:complete
MKSLAIKAAKGAGKILMKNFGKVKSVRVKDQESYVTNVDLESEKFIISTIREKYPDHDIVSEESGRLNKKSDYRWYIDPLDGTHNYIHKLPMFGVSIGLEYKGKIILGVIFLPYFNELYVAEKGKGAFLNGKKIKVSNKKMLKKSFIITDLVLRYLPEKKIDMLNKLKGSVYDIRVLGSAVYGYTSVAKGNADAYITIYTYPWDVAAGALIVEEASGKVTDFKGNGWDANTGKFISSNKKIHDQLVKVLR